MSKQIIDEVARHKIEQHLTQNFLVEAGAGSGKTTSLVNRMVNMIKMGTCNISEIAAITFTKKAAEELTTRFQTKLENEWRVEEDLSKKQNLESALANFDQCFLGTVHSFCACILRERPIEAGLDLQFREIEEREDQHIAIQAWNNFFEKMMVKDSERYHFIKRLGIPVSDLRQCFLRLIAYPDVDWVYVEKESPNISRVYHSFLNLLKEANHAIPSEPIEGRYDKLQELILQAIRKNKYENHETDAMKIGLLETFNKQLTITQKLWSSKEDAKYYLDKIVDFVEMKIQPLLEKWYEYVHGHIMPLMIDILHEYEILKKQMSYVNFHDLLIKTALLLKENSEVRGYFQEKYRSILVDEFQDTDPIQAEIMFYITAENLYEQDWTRCRPKQGSLFVVGDPKQAIYRFRRADIDIYNKVKELIGNQGGEILELTMNFRTLDSVTNSLNSFFKDKLPIQATEYQAAFKPLHSYFNDNHSTFSGIYQSIIPKEYVNKEEMIQFDAFQIAETINKMIQQGHQPKEFMILTRYNENLEVYYQALLENNIPAHLSGEITLANMTEFQELFHLVEFVKDPTNTVQLLAVLRGPFFGVSDQELFEWKYSGGSFNIYWTPSEDNVVESTFDFLQAFERLQTYVNWKYQYSPATVVEKMIEDIGFYPLLLLKGYGKNECQHLNSIITTIRSASTFYEAAELLKELIFTKRLVLNMDVGANAVRIMNVHKSKGLEAEIVFLANPVKKIDVKERISLHIKRTNTTSYGYFIVQKSNGFQTKMIACPPEWSIHQTEEYKYLIEEETRIVYVAATRAEKALIISTSEKTNKKNPWNDLVFAVQPNRIQVDDIMESEITEQEVQRKINVSNDYINELGMWINKHIQPTYATYSPTDEKDDIYQLDIDREKGGGMLWGTLIHEAFEKLIRGMKIENHIEDLLQKYGFSLQRKQEVYQSIQSFKHTKIWDQLQTAEIVLTEVPFNVRLSSEDPLYKKIRKSKDQQYSLLVKGVIDLAYQYKGNWYIVDYKTDRSKDREGIVRLTSYYEHQIALYRELWERIMHTSVHQTLLYFVFTDDICIV